MGKRQAACIVVVKWHAKERYSERGGVGELTSRKMRAHILGLLPSGVTVKEDCTIDVPLGGGLFAVCMPMFQGGWSVITVYKEGEKRVV